MAFPLLADSDSVELDCPAICFCPTGLASTSDNSPPTRSKFMLDRCRSIYFGFRPPGNGWELLERLCEVVAERDPSTTLPLASRVSDFAQDDTVWNSTEKS